MYIFVGNPIFSSTISTFSNSYLEMKIVPNMFFSHVYIATSIYSHHYSIISLQQVLSLATNTGT
jgi:hypothetical protein